MKSVLILTFLLIISQNIIAQDYQIGFTGSGQSSTVDSVLVINLEQGTSVTLMGTDVLSLIGTVGLHEATLTDNHMSVYPNPMNESSTIEFYNPDKGLTTVRISDIAGKTLAKYNSALDKGVQGFSIQGLPSGCYQINIRNSKVSCNTSLISVGNESSIPSIKYKGKVSDDGSENLVKRSKNIIQMEYTDGERLLFRGMSSSQARIITLIPTENQILDFEFIECTDFDNNSYPVVTIGDQTWMAENLKTTHYLNGDEIPNVIENSQWENLSTGAFCWVTNDLSWKDAYGALYNWYAVDDNRELCPAGWHVPTYDEWTILTDFLGGFYIAGGNMKSTRTEPDAHPRWILPNTGATNESGFSALPGGIRNTSGAFFTPGRFGYFWSSSEAISWEAWYLYIDTSWSVFNISTFNEGSGFSVRCLRD